MDWISKRRKLTEILKKYKYVALVLAVGLVLMLWPSKDAENGSEASVTATVSNERSIEEELATLLSQVEGAGKVEVMLTVAKGEETVYQTNSQNSITSDSNSLSTDTITITDAERNELGLVRQVNPPNYLGAIVICQGADNAKVRLAIIEAVSKVTGLGADKISVLKMK